jgi:hypothetical protein
MPDIEAWEQIAMLGWAHADPSKALSSLGGGEAQVGMDDSHALESHLKKLVHVVKVVIVMKPWAVAESEHTHEK